MLPWLDSPVKLHSDRADTSCGTLTPEQCAYRRGYWRHWYTADHVYALSTIYFLCAMTGVFILAHFSRHASPRVKDTGFWRKTVALLRYCSYRGFRVSKLRYWSPPLGVILVIATGAVFFFSMALGPKPYYWPNTKTVTYGGSPPIATRSGFMALALLPFVMLLASKTNLVTAFTGVSHEKLQIFHHWASYAMFVLALMHTFPFIVYNIKIGDLVDQWKTQVTYWTGVAALIPQAWLTFMSIPFFRNRFYELFKGTHFLAALLFILFLFFHCDFILSSWDYFIAMATLYSSCWLAATVKTFIFGIHTAHLEPTSSGLLRLSIPTVMGWKAGQHVFLRFCTGGHILTAHPFTISSSSPGQFVEEKMPVKMNEMVFYIAVNKGLTARLATLACKSSPTVPVYIEGPYGGPSSSDFSRFDTVLIVSGGSGAGFSIGLLEEIQKAKSGTKCRVVYATRTTKMAQWYIEEMERADPAGTCAFSVHVTRDEEAKAQVTETKRVTVGASDSQIQYARPDIPSVISALGNEANGRIAIFTCGPREMLYDVRRGAAAAQWKVWQGALQEVYLHSEAFE
ncbi:hypothetical protein ASPZODRAFT_16248 [Penicilliopsis zonata CBS 506.65]|uniref:ferric-chelate reductase (NADPH) n=1 Tax=Penicilliopsis zonata CBS 506.65 TaxID=1073090 RepID=A0A1L9SH55_9EURO|nr:hypothetical protein ASPZODRAFT_16248 [Penicilliopsis zonata CBS 506.65]OJJ46488.1 hypothetical protein ASPZODRAFT_16248 [Penicilliopsis zonata CBS 506.65]